MPSGTFEPKNEMIINEYLKPGMNVFDIGANIGYHTFYMAKLVNPGGVVYAIEPTNWAINKLEKNLSLNPTIDNVIIAQLALADESLGIQKLSFQSSYRLDGKIENDIQSIKVMKLDDFVVEYNIPLVNFIKMDVDGHEGKIFEGAKETIKKHHPGILFEINPKELALSGYPSSEIFRQLLSSGYMLYYDDMLPLNPSKFLVANKEVEQSIMVYALPT